MGGFNLFSRKEKNNFWTLVLLLLFVVFLIGKAIVESGHLLFYIICLVLWIIVYFVFLKLEKFVQSRPTSLWREYEKKYLIVPQYTPPKWINPAEAWLLYNRSVEPTDLTSLIYQWKFEKLIDIQTFTWKNSSREYIRLMKLKDMPLTRPLFESEIFDSIFCMWDVKIIEWAFQLRYALMLEDLEYHWIQKWRFTYKGSQKQKVRKIKDIEKDLWIQTYLFLIYLFLAAFSIIIDSFGIADKISISLTGFLWCLAIIILIGVWIALLYWKMDGRSDLKFTDKWAELASKVIGYSQFIKSCDENKIRLFLKEDPLFIDRTLPYATAFWMETQFLKKISPLRKDWNAKYIRWKKVSSWIWIFRFFMSDDDNSLL